MSESYQLCPGGTGKKLKFCCADLVQEIPKLEKMIEGEQRLACLDQIQRLEEKFPDRACLLTLKAAVQGMLGRRAEAEATVRHFFQVHPDNTIALSQAALLAAQEDRLPEAVALFGRAMEHCPKEMPTVVYQALSALADLLLIGGHSLPALALLRAQVAFAPQDSASRQALGSLERAQALPLLLRDDTYPELDPRRAGLTDAKQVETYLDALRHMFHVRYAQALAVLDELVAKSPQAAELWRTIGYIRAYALDERGAAEALRKFAGLAKSADDAVEAEALAQLLLNEDVVDQLFVEFPVNDADQVAAALTASLQTVEMPVDPRMAEEGQPPPRAAYAIFDHPRVETADVQAEAIPLVIGRVALFGKETDRSARLEVSVARWNLEKLQAQLTAWLPNSLGPASEPEVVSRQRLTLEILRTELQLPRGLTPERARELQTEVLRRRVMGLWPKTPLAALGGKTPLEAAHSSEQQRAVRAALLILELDVESTGAKFDFAELEQSLGLAPAAPLDPQGLDLDRLPLVRLRRLDFARLTDEQVGVAFDRATTFDLRRATREAALQVVARPQLLERIGAERLYYILASVCEDPADALKYLAEGRAAAQAAQQSTMIFDLQELEIHAVRRNLPEVERVLNLVLRNYGNQPGIREAVAQILMSAGIMLAPPEGAGRGGMMPPGAPPAEKPAESGIWTPDADRGGGQKSALWTPGMD
ncbi:MAG: hypothetical protein JNG90_08530 [Planctomycetaceae bacterium]|nr:hypothetical protein [Planctomycetaceae bacterium]